MTEKLFENVYHDLEKEGATGEVGYKEFEGICLTDTFELNENDDIIQLPNMDSFKENTERVNRQKKAPLKVIIGNPQFLGLFLLIDFPPG